MSAVGRRIVAVVASLVVLGIGLSASTAAAGQPAAAVTGAVDAGFGGRFVPGRPVPVRVTLEATRLTAGQLTVQLGGPYAEVVDFEITGGSSEEHWMLLDTPGHEGVIAEASVEIDGRTTDLDPLALRWEGPSEIVGVLPTLAASMPQDARTEILGHELALVALEPALLDLGPEALGAVGSIATTPEDLAQLPPEHLRTVLGWLHTGGTLYVDAPAGTILELPDELHPVAGWVRAGAATVVATDGALAAGRWSEVVVPGPNRSIYEDRDASANVPMGDLQSELIGLDLGRDLPALLGLLAVLGVYIVLVGPVAYLVTRQRSMARWVAIPVLAGLATGVLFLSGEGMGTDTTADLVDVIETGPGLAVASSRVVLSSDRGDRTIEAPPGWTVSVDEQFGFGFGFDPGMGTSGLVQRRTADGVRMAVPAVPGGISMVSTSGPVDFDGALEVTAATDADGRVTGEVRNTTDVTLTDVAVFSGRTASTQVGDLEAGESTSFEIEGTDRFRFAVDPFREAWPGGVGGELGPGEFATTTMPAAPPGIGPIVSETCDETGFCEQCDADGNCFGFGGGGGFMPPPMECDEFGNCFPAGTCRGSGCADVPVRPASLSAALWDRGTSVMPPGLVTAVGWTDDLRPLVDLGDGVDVKSIRTAVVGRATPVAAGDRLTDAASVRSMVSVENTGDLEIVFDFRMPPTAGDRPLDPTRLRLHVPDGFMRIAVLVPGGEQVVVDPGAPPGAVDRSAVAVPPGALVSGHVFVKATLPFAPPGPGRELLIFEAAA